MGIDVRLETENAEPIGETLFDQSNYLAKALDAAPGSLLQFIDPYGNTIFNQRQLPALAKELEFAAGRAAGPLRERLMDVLNLLQNGLDKPHVYARFIGD